MKDKNRVLLFDTTMRDGEQSPGASMSLEEKIQISRIFDEMGIDIIEAGFPIASPGDFEAVTAISKILKNSIPAGLSRHSKKDIDVCHEALNACLPECLPIIKEVFLTPTLSGVIISYVFLFLSIPS